MVVALSFSFILAVLCMVLIFDVDTICSGGWSYILGVFLFLILSPRCGYPGKVGSCINLDCAFML